MMILISSPGLDVITLTFKRYIRIRSFQANKIIVEGEAGLADSFNIPFASTYGILHLCLTIP